MSRREKWFLYTVILAGLAAGTATAVYSLLPVQLSADARPTAADPVEENPDSNGDESPTIDHQIFEHAPGDPDARHNLAEAIRAHRRALAIEGDHAETHSNLAAALAANDELDKAIYHFRQAVELKPDNAQGHLNLGNALFAQGSLEEAIRHYRRAVELKTDYAKAHNNLAVALKQTGRLEEAYQHMHEAMRLKREGHLTSQDNRANLAPTTELDRDSEQEDSSGDEPLTIVKTTHVQERQAAHEASLDPRQDGWDTEVIAESAKSNLDRIAQLLTAGRKIKSGDLTENVSDEFSCRRLRPVQFSEMFRDATIVVRQEMVAAQHETDRTYLGAAGLAEALTEMARPLLGASDTHVHVKIVRVAKTSDKIDTTAFVEASGRTPSGTIGQHATWDCQWTGQPSELSRLLSIHARDYKEITATNPQGVWFSDCTEAVLGQNPSFGQQLVYGLNHWLTRIGRVQGMHVFARWGLAVGDCNGDGLDDVYVCQPGGLPNRLFVQNLDGTASDRSQSAGVDWLDHTSSALFIDLDNDADQDLVVTTMSGLLVMENDSTGRFRTRATLPPADVDLHSLSAADYDGDGDLDLYVCIDFANRQALRGESSVGFVYHNANDGGANALFRNDIASGVGNKWRFTDVTQQTGLDVHNRRHSLAAAWEDYDNDGDLDLYVANDYGQNCLYRNERGRFVDVAPAANVVDFGSGMSVSWGDYNRDGWMDLYVGNMFSSAGSRITRQADFKAGIDTSTRAIYSRFAKGNSLFENIGETGPEYPEAGRGFREVGEAAAVEMARWAWSSVFADLNNDGWEDLFVANGYITTEDTGDL